jgi:hypothetical protein
MAIRGSMTRGVPVRRLTTACVLALLMAASACSGSGSKNSAGGASAASNDTEKRRAYSQCMRDNGVPDFPDPDPNGQFGGPSHDAINRDDPTYKAANEKCRDLLPAGDKHDVVGPETVQQMVKFAQCMRANGVPDFPDPDAAGKFPRSAEEKAHSDPQFKAAVDKCQKDMPQHGGG